MIASNPPLVTAVVTTFNRRREAKDAIESVLAQTYAPLEIIVVEDSGDSGIERWLHGDPRTGKVRFIRHETNRGLAAARNTGARAAHGEYVAFLDDDDLWQPDRIRAQMELIGKLDSATRARLGVVTCAAEVRDPATGRTWITQRVNEGDLRAAILAEGPKTIPSTYLFPKGVVEALGGFDESLRSSIDHDMWLSLARGGYVGVHVPVPLVIMFDRSMRPTMMGDPVARLRGVQALVSKWRPYLQEWMGPEVADRYIQAYSDRVAGLLVKNLVSRGLWGAALSNIRTAMKGSRYSLSTASALFSSATRGLAKSAIRALQSPRARYALSERDEAA